MNASTVHAAATATADTPLVLGDVSLDSRLLVGTGKYATYDLMRDALHSGAFEREDTVRYRLHVRINGHWLEVFGRSFAANG